MMTLDGVKAVIARETTSALPTAVGMTDFGSCMVKLWSCWGIHVTDMAGVKAMDKRGQDSGKVVFQVLDECET
jgi:hypothetical protein